MEVLMNAAREVFWSVVVCMLILGEVAGASPAITSSSNSKTNTNVTNFTIGTGESASLQVFSNETVDNWNWAVDDAAQSNNAPTLAFAKSEYGLYRVAVNGSNANGTTQTVTWNVTVELTVVDGLGRTVKISKKPERIISLAPSNTEILFALGLGSKVVGVTNYCNYPPEASSKTKVGGYTTPSPEKIVGLTPDLILASEKTPIDVINFLATSYIVVGLKPKNLDEVLSNIELVGKITKETSNASNITTNMGQRIMRIKNNVSSLAQTQKFRVFYTVWANPIKTAGSGTFADDLITTAGGINIASDVNGWAVFSSESLVTRNPQVIICSGMGTSESICDSLKSTSSLSITDAHKTGRFHSVQDPNIIERPGPRIVDGLEEIYGVLKVQTVSGGLVQNLTPDSIMPLKVDIPDVFPVVNVKSSASGDAAFGVQKSSDPPSGTSADANSIGKYINITGNMTDKMAWAILRVYYTQSELDASHLSEDSLELARYDTSSQNWEQLASNVDTTDVGSYAGSVWANVSHFSTFTVTGNKNPYCGDGVCSGGDTCSNCPQDCGSCSSGGGGSSMSDMAYITAAPTTSPTSTQTPVSTVTPSPSRTLAPTSAAEELEEPSKTSTPVQTPQPTTSTGEYRIPSIQPMWYVAIAVIIVVLAVAVTKRRYI
jgi:iron complex transport system substrate-binding protein